MIGHENFIAGATRTVQQLQAQTGIACWAVSRLTAGRQVFLYKKVANPALYLEPWLPSRESICARMLELNGPRAVSDVLDEPAYAKTKLATTLPVAAFIGTPINIQPTPGRSTLFGTLCGFDPDPNPSIAEHLPEVERCADQLGALLDYELGIVDNARRLAQRQITGRVATRQSWYDAIKTENDRSWRYGDVTSALVIETMDRQLDATIDMIIGLMPSINFVATLSAASLGILAPLCDIRNAQLLMNKIAAAADERGLRLAGGHETRGPLMNMDQTWLMANAALEPLADSRTPQLAHVAI